MDHDSRWPGRTNTTRIRTRRGAAIVALAASGCASARPPLAPLDQIAVDASLAPDTPAAPDVASRCALEASGRLLDLAAAIVAAMRAHAASGSDALVVPDATTRDAFAALVVRVLGGDEAAACALPAPYRLLHITDPIAGVVRVVAELDASGQPAPALFYGTYAAPVSPSTRRLAVEAPHPLFDLNTAIESTDLFVQGRAPWLLIAGAHRCADHAPSPCDGTTTACGATAPYRASDAAHETALPFFAIHALLSAQSADLVFLQLHGNADACPAALLSDGSGVWSDAGPTGALAAALDARGVAIGHCGDGFPTAGCSLCGTDNVQVRASAGASDACAAVGSHYGRVVHLEQQPGLRASPSDGTPGYQPLIDAALAALP